MMRKVLSRIVAVNLLILLILIGMIDVPVRALDGNSGPVSRVVRAGSKATMRRDGWARFDRLSIGTTLLATDLVDPKGDIVQVLCPDLKLETIVELGPAPCPKDREILIVDNAALAAWQRGPVVDLSIPFLIAPRGMKVSTATPLLWWNAVTDADSYKVTLHGDGLNWSTVTKSTHLSYPKDAPPLIPDKPYSVEVVALAQGIEGHSSAEEDAPDMAFSVMNPTDYVPIQKTVRAIYASVSQKPIADLIVGNYLAQQGLSSEGLKLLWGLSGNLFDSTAAPSRILASSSVLYLSLADTAMRSNLSLLAQRGYQRALEISTANEETENQALATLGLARLAVDANTQVQLARKAMSLWAQVGASNQRDQVAIEFNLIAP